MDINDYTYRTIMNIIIFLEDAIKKHQKLGNAYCCLYFENEKQNAIKELVNYLSKQLKKDKLRN